MTDADVIDAVLAKEGGLRDAVQRPDGSWDPLTLRGVTTVTLGAWRKLGRPATRAELLAMSATETREILRAGYIVGPGFTPDKIPHDPLRLNVADFAVNSGAQRATRWLQRVCRLPVTSVMDAPTVAWLHAHAGYLWLVNEALVAVRVRMLESGVGEGWLRPEDRSGVMHRALSFLETPRA